MTLTKILTWSKWKDLIDNIYISECYIIKPTTTVSRKDWKGEHLTWGGNFACDTGICNCFFTTMAQVLCIFMGVNEQFKVTENLLPHTTTTPSYMCMYITPTICHCLVMKSRAIYLFFINSQTKTPHFANTTPKELQSPTFFVVIVVQSYLNSVNKVCIMLKND